jgi:hypothetical protein
MFQTRPCGQTSPRCGSSEQDDSHEAGGELVISSGVTALLLEMSNEDSIRDRSAQRGLLIEYCTLRLLLLAISGVAPLSPNSSRIASLS